MTEQQTSFSPPRKSGVSFALGAAILAGATVLLSAPAAWSEEAAAPASDAALAADAPKPTGFWERDTLTGDWGGLRSRLADQGVSLSATEIAETLGNVSGGQRQTDVFEGRLEMDLDLDLEKLGGWHGGTIHISGWQSHGRGLSVNGLGNNILGDSGIEATRGTRLFDAYFQQSFLGDTTSVRIGQLGADEEFLVSQYAATFVGATFGWPGSAAADLKSGGPAFPLATPGIRVKSQFDESHSVMVGLFNGDPAGAAATAQSNPNPQIRDHTGTAFSTDQNALVISEFAYGTVSDKGVAPTLYKIGGWYHSGQFSDPRYDVRGRLLAVTGDPARSDNGNWAVYGVVDQLLTGTADQGLAGFVRLSVSPGDRNLISDYIDAGLNYKAPFEGRDNDVAGIAVSYAKVGSGFSDSDRDLNAASHTNRAVRDYEAVIEATYIYALAPWWSLQPDVQYILHPGAGAANPSNQATNASRMDNALVLGLRSSVKF